MAGHARIYYDIVRAPDGRTLEFCCFSRARRERAMRLFSCDDSFSYQESNIFAETILSESICLDVNPI